MENKIRVASWNLCLGLNNKKDNVSQMIVEHKIDICCMQEIDVKNDYNFSLLTNESNYIK